MNATPSCIACGHDLASSRGTCVGCSQRPLRLHVHAAVPVSSLVPRTVPAHCCCCLAPTELTKPTRVFVAPERFFLQDVPWCKSCSGRGRLSMLFMIGGLFLGAFAGLAALSPMGDGLGLLGFFGGMFVGVAVGIFLRRLLDQPGHAPGCMAVSEAPTGVPEPDMGKLVFHNVVFARAWCMANDTEPLIVSERHGGPLVE